MAGAPSRLAHAFIAISLGLLAVVVLVATSRDIGLTWDEPIYMVAAESYSGWVQELVTRPSYALGEQAIAEAWNINHEHPDIDKLWAGLVWSSARQFTDDVTAHRLGNMLLSGLLVALAYLMVAPDRGRIAGVAAGVSLLAMPRVFFHAHLASQDVPAAVGIAAVTYLFWVSRYRRGLGWTVLLGLVFGLAIGINIHPLFELPLILGLWTLAAARRPYLVVRLVAMGAIGLVVWIALWPWLYEDTLRRLLDYVTFYLFNHQQISQWYLHRNYLPPPWHYPFVMTVAVVPLTISILAVIGVLGPLRSGRVQLTCLVQAGWARPGRSPARAQAQTGPGQPGRQRSPEPGLYHLRLLLVIGALIPIVTLVIGRSMIFDGERLWMPTFFFIAVLAGLGFATVFDFAHVMARRFSPSVPSSLVALALAAIVLAPQAIQSVGLYPHLLSYYSETIGGLRGANRLGLETTYWAETYADTLDYLNANAPTGSLIWVEAHDVMLYYQRLGLLRPDLRIASVRGDEGIVPGTIGHRASIDEADFAVIEARQSGYSVAVRNWTATRQPVYERKYDNTILVAIYRR